MDGCLPQTKKHAETRSTPINNTPFTHGSEPWGARTFVPVQPRHPDIPAAALKNAGKSIRRRPPLGLSVVSYNILADSNSVRLRNCAQAVTNWSRRRETLLKEIFSVRADVLCLQDVDFFHEWWGPQLSSAGYDSLFKQRTSRAAVHREGIVVAWKRDVFDLFRSGEMELNRLGEHEEDRALAGKAATSDNVALMALLQPWEDSDHPSGACVVCTQLHDGEGRNGEAVRSLQARGLTRTIEAFNSDFALPIILCGTMNCLPSSGTYEILCRGIEAQDPSPPDAPGKPLAEPISTSAARIRWAAPPENGEHLSPAVDTYRILWVPGGSRFLPGESLDVHAADCFVYDLVETASGNVKSQQNLLRCFVVTGLSSGVAYEFSVSAVNSLGQSPWSERSEPVRMPRMADNEPEDKVLLSAASIKLLRKRELEEARRRAEEQLADPRAYEVRKLVKVEGLSDLGREILHPFDSVSGKTPRYSDAALHPDSANVRTDTGFPIIDAAGEQILGPEKGSPGELRGHRRGAKGVASAGSRRRFDVNRATSSAEGHSNDDFSSRTDISAPMTSSDTGKGQTLGGRPDRNTEKWPALMPTHDSQSGTGVRGEPSVGQSLTASDNVERDRDVLLRLDALNISGARSERQKHALGLRSAYMSYSSGGEPAFTALSETMSGTVDFIFYSADCLLPLEVLSLPEMGSIVGRDVQQTEVIPVLDGGQDEAGSWVPVDWQGDCGERGYMGVWSPYLRENPRRLKHQIPNELFPSDHLMLMANLVYFEARCPSTWR